MPGLDAVRGEIRVGRQHLQLGRFEIRLPCFLLLRPALGRVGTTAAAARDADQCDGENRPGGNESGGQGAVRNMIGANRPARPASPSLPAACHECSVNLDSRSGVEACSPQKKAGTAKR